MRKRLHVFGSTLRGRTPEEKADLTARFRTFARPRFETGELRPVIDRVLPLSQAAEAHRLLETNATTGKVVLRCD